MKPRPQKEPETGSAERQKDGRGDTARKPSCPGKCGGLSDYTQVSKSLTNMEGKRLLRLPARTSQSLRLLGVTSSRYRMGLRLSNSSRAGQGA